MNNELNHHGILGQKWGIRRFQNKDGSLTQAGRKRLRESTNNSTKNENPKVQRISNRNKYLSGQKAELDKQVALNKSERNLISEKLARKDLSNNDRWDLEEMLELLDMEQDALKTKISDIGWEMRYNDAYSEYFKK